MSDNPSTNMSQTSGAAGQSTPANIGSASDTASDQISRNFGASGGEAAAQTNDAATTPLSGRGAGGVARAKSRQVRPQGSGAMGLRMPDDLPAPPREAIDRAASDARATGHRFDLMRYLRLRRRNTNT